MANGGSLVGVRICRAGGAAGRSCCRAVCAWLTVETLRCVGNPCRKKINQQLIINRQRMSGKKTKRSFFLHTQTGSFNVPETWMFLNSTGLTALPSRENVAVLQYRTLLPLLSSICREEMWRGTRGRISFLSIRRQMRNCFEVDKPCSGSSSSLKSSSSGCQNLWPDTGRSEPKEKREPLPQFYFGTPEAVTQQLHLQRTQSRCCCPGRNIQRTRLQVSSGSQHKRVLQCTHLCWRLHSHPLVSR